MKQSNTKILTTAAMMVALASILSVFPKFNGLWPNGGSITICCMLPIVLVSYLYGIKWGLMAGGAFAAIQLLSDLRAIAGADLMTTFLVILIDYVIAFVVLGFGGIFRNKFGDSAKELCLGSIFALSLRFCSHLVSGFLLFSSYAEWFFTQENFALGNSIYAALGNGTPLYLLYSVMYNGSYMIPEIILTAIAAYIIGKQKFIKDMMI